MKRVSNSTVARGISVSDPTAAGWDALDRMPAAVRHALWGTPVPINPLSAEALLREMTEGEACEALIEAAGQEMRRFSSDHARLHGQPTPHVLAMATVQTYARPSSGRQGRPRR